MSTKAPRGVTDGSQATVTPEKHWGMVIDLTRCIGCETCAVGCKMKNNLADGVWWNRVLTVGGGELDVVGGTIDHPRAYALPLACQHCENPPCVKVCPTGAAWRRADGVVLIHEERCIGCRTCIQACPYGVRLFNDEVTYAHVPEEVTLGAATAQDHDVGVVEKCNFCVDRLDQGLDPMCIDVCPARARFFGDLNDPESTVSQLIVERGAETLHPELDTRPSVYFIPVEHIRAHPTGLDRLHREDPAAAQGTRLRDTPEDENAGGGTG